MQPTRQRLPLNAQFEVRTTRLALIVFWQTCRSSFPESGAQAICFYHQPNDENESESHQMEVEKAAQAIERCSSSTATCDKEDAKINVDDVGEVEMKPPRDGGYG